MDHPLSIRLTPGRPAVEEEDVGWYSRQDYDRTYRLVKAVTFAPNTATLSVTTIGLHRENVIGLTNLEDQ